MNLIKKVVSGCRPNPAVREHFIRQTERELAAALATQDDSWGRRHVHRDEQRRTARKRRPNDGT